MKIENKAYVTIEYTLKLDSGDVVDKSPADKPLGFIYNSGQIIPGLEKGLVGLEKGDTATVTVEPEDAYGVRRPELERELPRENFPKDLDIKTGMSFEAHGPQGPIQFIVKAINDDSITADFNHPLAGQRLHFDVKVEGVREATDEEMAALLAAHNCSHGECGSCH